MPDAEDSGGVANLATNETVAALVRFFRNVAARNEALLRELREEPSFAITNDQWLFTLPALHAFLQRNVACFAGVTYRQFRKSLFASPINGAINGQRATIAIVENTGKVDRSTYALVWLDAAPNS